MTHLPDLGIVVGQLPDGRQAFPYRITDTGGDHHNWMAYLMFFTPLMDGAVWGADLSKSPVMLNPQLIGAPPIDVFMVPAGWWSDGTADQ